MKRSAASAIAACCLIALTAIGAAGRWYHFDSATFSPDEAWAAYLASGHGDVVFTAPRNRVLPPYRVDFSDPSTSWWNVVTGLSGVTHPPLYYLALHAWGRTMGESNFRLRLFSGICSVLCIPAMYGVARQRNGVLASLFAAAFMTCAWSQIEFAQQARPYAMVLLLSLSCAGALQAVETKPTTARTLWLFVSVFALALTHYLAAGVIGAMLVYAMMMHGRSRSVGTAAVAGAVASAALLWFPFFIRSLRPSATLYSEYLRTPKAHVLFDAMMAPARLLLYYPTAAAGVPVFIFLVLAAVWAGRRSALWSLWLIFTFVLLCAFDLLRQTEMLFEMKYIVVMFPAIVGLIAFNGGGSRGFAVIGLTLALLAGVASDGINRSLGQSESMILWIRVNPPVREGNVLVFEHEGLQPFDYVAYRREHPNMTEQIEFKFAEPH